MPFEFSVENLANATGVTTNTRYLIYLVRIRASVCEMERSDS